jgi:glyceraldehyde 3-phosphate dehydrogenase
MKLNADEKVKPMPRVAINGLGRIGKLALKPLLDRGAKIAWINDAVGDPEMHAHLLEFDTVHGRWTADFSYDADSLTIDGTRLPFIGTRDISELPLDGIDVVIDCTGVFKTEAKIAPYFDAGLRRLWCQRQSRTVMPRTSSMVSMKVSMTQTTIALLRQLVVRPTVLLLW